LLQKVYRFCFRKYIEKALSIARTSQPNIIDAHNYLFLLVKSDLDRNTKTNIPGIICFRQPDEMSVRITPGTAFHPHTETLFRDVWAQTIDRAFGAAVRHGRERHHRRFFSLV
jgi:hypothetical protein